MSVVQDKNYDKSLNDAVGSKYLIANGYFGYRGTLDEESKEDMVAVNVNGLFDVAEGMEIESVNAFNPLYTRCYIGDNPIKREGRKNNLHRIELNLKNGVFRRVTTFDIDGIMITVVSERFIDQENLHMIYSRYHVVADSEVSIEMIQGIDTDIWNIKDNHLIVVKKEKSGQKIIVSGKTKVENTPLVVGLMSVKNFRHRDNSSDDAVFKYYIDFETGKEYEIFKYACLMHSDDVDYEKMDKYLENAKKIGYEALKEKNELYWQKLWDIARIEVINNSLADRITQYSIFQLVSHRPYSDRVSVPYKGLSGQFKNGAYYWLNEFFLLKFYLNTFPESARHMIMNRINGLSGAMTLAKEYDYVGAYYPELVSSDGMPLDYSNERKDAIFINGMIVYALYEYIFRTGDISVLFAGGLKMAIECIKFYNSIAKLNSTKTHYDYPNVLGLDKNHPGVTNSALTNRLIRNAYDVTLKMITMVKTNDKNYWQKLFDENGYEKDILRLREIRRKFYLKNPNVNNLVEQFDNFYDLEEITIKDWKKLTKSESEDLSKYQIVENPEVFAVSFLFPDDYELKVKAANYDLYFNKLSSRLYMSKTLSLLLACELNNTRRAIKQFMNLGDVDIKVTKRFNKGLDMFVCGAVYISMVYGFAGLRFNEYLPYTNLWLPTDIRRLEFHIMHMGKIGFVKIKRNITSIEWE